MVEIEVKNKKEKEKKKIRKVFANLLIGKYI